MDEESTSEQLKWWVFEQGGVRGAEYVYAATASEAVERYCESKAVSVKDRVYACNAELTERFRIGVVFG